MSLVDENKILERRLQVLKTVYKDVCGKQVSEKFMQSMKNAKEENISMQDKIRLANELIDVVMDIHYRKKYLHSLLEA
jgi:hypothetical protein